MTDQTEREGFETRFKDQFILDHDNGNYIHVRAQVAWEAWQARAALYGGVVSQVPPLQRGNRFLMWWKRFIPGAHEALAMDAFRSAAEGATENLRDLWAALSLVREAVENVAPPDSVPNAEYLQPTPQKEAEAIVRGIYALRAQQPALDGGAVSQSNDLRLCRAALHWLLSHYEVGKPELHDRVVARIESIQKWQHPEIADMELMRSMYPEEAYQHIDLRAPQQPSSERDLLLEFAEYFNWGRNKYVDTGGYTQSRSPREAVKHFLASRQEKNNEAE